MASDQQPLHKKKAGGPKSEAVPPEPLPAKKKCSGYSVYKTCSIIYAIIFVLIGVLLTGLAVWILIVKQGFEPINNDILGPLILLLVVGIIIVATALVGCIGASCDKLWPLRIFLGIVILVFILQVIIGILAYVYREKTIEKFGDRIGFVIPKYSTDGDIKKAVDKAQRYFECCGIKEPSDWNRNLDVRGVPDSCCQDETENCGSRIKPNVKNAPNLQSSGCEDKFRTWVETKLDTIGATALAMAILHILGIFVVYMFITKVEDRIRLFKYRKRYYS